MQTIVIDLSSGNMIEAGFAGDDAQKVSLPTSALDQFGVVADFSKLEQDLRQVFQQLGADLINCNILISEVARAPKSERENKAKVLFDTFKVAGCCVATEALLVLYGSGLETCVVVICKKESIAIVPYYETLFMMHAVTQLPSGRSNEEIGTAIYSSILKCDAPQRPNIYKNIIVAGDYPLNEAAISQCRQTIKNFAPPAQTVNMALVSNHQHIVWKGGSIVAAEPFMSTLWFTKAEYEANGATFVHRKWLF